MPEELQPLTVCEIESFVELTEHTDNDETPDRRCSAELTWSVIHRSFSDRSGGKRLPEGTGTF